MTVNIFTDASVNTVKGGSCGFAFYIANRNFKVQRAGVLKAPGDSSNLAELYAITNALAVLNKARLKGITSVVIHTDSMNVINQLSFSGRTDRALKAGAIEALYLMLDFCLAQGRTHRQLYETFSFVHVKSHRRGNDKHSCINRWCDREAGRARKLGDKYVMDEKIT